MQASSETLKSSTDVLDPVVIVTPINQGPFWLVKDLSNNITSDYFSFLLLQTWLKVILKTHSLNCPSMQMIYHLNN